ncbi:phosphotransferase family protein [Aciduricibacillus chroicocephali]|uniref:Phosphotransferase family protein n=1 Tax=Aciduricibacillus chroicocephali TaxID=3054939 RepID=A0ABY9L045_9BACI|nr:phosphotransferase family protein [Bacillaceae bacterium 44XB]
MKRILGTGWEIQSAGGLTGDAYIAEKDGKRLFLKRNTSPFLAVLSAEGIVPKLVWTKRMENGDVITAQEWLEGRELTAGEMAGKPVAELLRRIHGSQELLHMLMRLGKKPLNPMEAQKVLEEELFEQFGKEWPIGVKEALTFFESFLPAVCDQQMAVCHGDLNHHNLILTVTDQVYLIDWDNAMIADPAADIGIMLRTYVPPAQWPSWLEAYGIADEKLLIPRMFWYLLLDALRYVIWHSKRNDEFELEKRLRDLRLLNSQIVQLTSNGLKNKMQ